jgi:ABC-type lipopolysaccharide export system ATPase subunit
VVLGPNGAGKTTSFMIVGLVRSLIQETFILMI